MHMFIFCAQCLVVHGMRSGRAARQTSGSSPENWLRRSVAHPTSRRSSRRGRSLLSEVNARGKQLPEQYAPKTETVWTCGWSTSHARAQLSIKSNPVATAARNSGRPQWNAGHPGMRRHARARDQPYQRNRKCLRRQMPGSGLATGSAGKRRTMGSGASQTERHRPAAGTPNAQCCTAS